MLGSSLDARARLVAVVVGAILGVGCFSGLARGATLPDGRAYELVSPGNKLGNDVLASSTRTHAALGEATGLPAAVAFASLGGFGDVSGTGLETEYVAQRDGAAGTSGWRTHAITPPQDPLPLIAVIRGLAPLYPGEMADDLTKAVFQSWTPVTQAPNVAHVPNLYAREDLRATTSGSYRLLTNAPTLLPAPDAFSSSHPFFVQGTQDLQHVLFETTAAVTADASPGYVKLYKADGAKTRLVSAGPTCPGGSASFRGPCSAAGLGASAFRYTQRVLSKDGSRALFTSPVTSGGAVVLRSGVASKILQLDDSGTARDEDDIVIQVNASEKTSPDTSQSASYQIANVDGSRVFFISSEQLTSTAGGGLYLWERKPVDEMQTVHITATGGAFTLTFHSQISTGTGDLSSGSRSVSGATGSFAVGQVVSGPGIPADTKITAMGAFTNPFNANLTLSADATTSDTQAALTASTDARTASLAYDASAAQVQSALEALAGIGSGNVTVSGGPGGAGGGSPYIVTFSGALAGVNVAELTVDARGLTGIAPSATTATTRPVHNLTLIVAAPVGEDTGTIGASEDGHRVYISAPGAQLVSGGPSVRDRALYYWQDADGIPGGTLSFVGGVQGGDVPPLVNLAQTGAGGKLARVTPDGRTLIFEVSDGSDLAPRYDQLNCLEADANPNNNGGGGCSEVYVYRADGSTPTAPDLVCASCRPSGAPATANAWINIRRNASATSATTHLSRALSDDGRRVLFSTAESLLPQDTNGKFDVYEYDVPSATVHLISSATDTGDSYFLDASADGHDVYFTTREQLVGWDTDRAYDLYDARIGGGFPEPPAPVRECDDADACRGTTPVPPSVAGVGSSAFKGLGNASPGRRGTGSHPAGLRCKHGQVKRRVKSRTRCVRRTRANRSKRAKHRTAKRRGR